MKSVFVDSHVVLYLLSPERAKADQAQALLRRRPWISVQVLNEVTHVCRRKLRMSWEDIDEFLSLVRWFCKVAPLTERVHDHARQLAQQYGFSFYDACIVAAAVDKKCHELYSEDMQHGLQLSEGLLISNPFLSEGS